MKLGVYLTGQQVTLRLDRHRAHVIADGQLVKTILSPIFRNKPAASTGLARREGAIADGSAGRDQAHAHDPRRRLTQVAGQRLLVGRSHAGKTVVVRSGLPQNRVTASGGLRS